MLLTDACQNHVQYMITYMIADPKKMRVVAKRTTLILDFSPRRSGGGFPWDQLSVNYSFCAANAPTTYVLFLSESDIELSSNSSWE